MIGCTILHIPRADAAVPQDIPAAHIVFVVGEKLYDTAETLPRFARRELESAGFRTTFVYADSTDPNSFPGLEAINEADLVFLSVRRRALPLEQLDMLREYLTAGNPLVAIRTSSHAFTLRDEESPEGYGQWPTFDRDVLGARYEGHYPNREGTGVYMRPETENHPILNRVYEPTFRSSGTLYRSRDIDPSARVLLTGAAVVDGERVTEPVAWTSMYRGGRVFYTALGHPEDFERVSFRRMLVNAVFWTLDRRVPGMETMAATSEVAGYMRTFEGRGELGGATNYTPPADAVRQFDLPEGIAVDLAASEPDIHQPLYVTFDARGRLWVVQYNQYPYPEGVRVTGYDHHLRATFDAEPAPPPGGPAGADRITMLEDTDGDGAFDRAENVITGLNIATSVAFGRGGIWVLTPPYLLKYPDVDGDGRPDGDPVVHLKGFGLQDTHSVANSLEWGPDGWLYGASGSTTIDTVSSSVTTEVAYQGQAIWRYHPETERFEIFAEGGGNTFDVEFDAKGRLYSGNNGGNSRGFHYKQGAYYEKNWGKHGALTNPYAFGYIEWMPHTGDEKRFTHAEIVYGSTSLPDRYVGALVSLNPLQNWIQVSALEPAGSTFETVDTERLVETPDDWFRPVDITDGPDGAIYVADWYDDRLTHVDPRDTWHRSSGRIYRIRGASMKGYSARDLTKLSTDELIDVLSSPNEWERRSALRLIGDRRDRSVIPRLRTTVEENDGQLALEALWALHLSGGFDETWAPAGLDHDDPFVRMWTVRLLGDTRDVSSGIANRLTALARGDDNPFVRSQLAASAGRLPGSDALPIIRQLMGHEEDIEDQQIPLQVWWALEVHAESHRNGITDLFREDDLWKEPLVKTFILDRLMKRYVMAGDTAGLETAAELLELAPTESAARQLMTGLQEGLRGTGLRVADLPPDLQAALRAYQERIGRSDRVLAVRQGDEQALAELLQTIADPTADPALRIEYITVLGAIDRPELVEPLLEVLGESESTGIRRAILSALSRYETERIGREVTDLYPNQLRADPAVRMAALELLVSRKKWAGHLLASVDSHRIDTGDVPIQLVRRMLLLDDAAIDRYVDEHWPGAGVSASSDADQEVMRVLEIVRGGKSNADRGRLVFRRTCGTCHALRGEGGDIGPDLSGYDRDNMQYLVLQTVRPNASIREGYVNHIVKTTDGRTLTGIVTERSGGAVTLESLAGQSTTIPADETVEIRPLDRSIMPEGLLRPLSDREVRDLFEYIRSKE